MQRSVHIIQGHVQGVGFRPFIYREAKHFGLTGFIRNTHAGVYLEIQGTQSALAAFNEALYTKLPPLASIHSHTQEAIDVIENEEYFHIDLSQNSEPGSHDAYSVLISPDVAPCSACLQEMHNPHDRRAQYPFINCTDCGPRITITQEVPYDRHNTSMHCFPLCPDCAKEYNDPTNRRFHAQANACAVCGPHIWLSTADEIDSHQKPKQTTQTILHSMYEALDAGKILAIKGLGGFHLVCDATNSIAIDTLRKRKRRPHKPLAIMLADLHSARKIATITEMEATQLQSPERPIVLVSKLPNTLPENIAPDAALTISKYDLEKIKTQNTPSQIGIMFPSTPLHELIMHGYQKPLVMTSGNASGDPICLGNREALSALAHIADLFVLHNRDILIRQDDSVLCEGASTKKTMDGIELCAGASSPMLLRRSRGYVPRPITLASTSPPVLANTSPPVLARVSPPILACGALLKNTLTCTRNQVAFVSQHIGDLESPKSLAFFETMAMRLPHFLHVQPEALVADLHPDYPSTQWAIDTAQARKIPLIRVQHHVAHAYAVLAEHRHTTPALALCLDGVGLGFDKSSWGGELLFIHPQALRHPQALGHPQSRNLSQEIHNAQNFQMPHNSQYSDDAYARLGHMQAIPLPTGDADVRAPWRLALALTALHTDIPATRPWPWELDPSSATIAPHIATLSQQGHGSHTTSCGRLFDAVSALLGLCHTISYEGQAAIRLEHMANADPTPSATVIPLDIHEHKGYLQLDTHTLFRHIMTGWQQQVPVPLLAAIFHDTLAEGLANLAQKASTSTGVKHIALAGGVLHNTRLRQSLVQALQKRGLMPLLPCAFPPNDGSISLGQAAYATALLHH